MTLEEKLEHFNSSVISTATEQSAAIVDEYKISLQKTFDDRKHAANRKAESTFKVETDAIWREKNRKLSNETLEIKRKVLEKTDEIKNRLFKDVEVKLKEYMKTPAYEELLCIKINEANEFAKGDEITIYLNPSDEHLKSSLEQKTGVKLTISDRDFFGGIRAVIPSRSILIDHSFITKLAEEKNSFKL